MLGRGIEVIRTRQSLEVEYQLLSSPAPRWRWIAPHAIAFDGFRWHARAYGFTGGCFKDFLLARILGIRDTWSSDIDASHHADWHTQVTLEIGPHPGLSGAQNKIVAPDCGMCEGNAKDHRPQGLALLHAQTPRAGNRPTARNPADQQIVLLSQ